MHIVVVGCGRVGSELAGLLEKSGHTVAVVDKRASAFRRLPTGFGGKTIVGFGFDRDTLREAGIEEAGALAAVTSGDNSNIMSARVARETFSIDRVVARIYDPRRAAIYQRLGIPTVATVSWTTDQVIRRLLPESMDSDWIDASGNVALVERALPAAWAGRLLKQLDEPGRYTLERGHPVGQRHGRRPVSRRPGGRHPPHRHPARRARRAPGTAHHHRGRRPPLMLVAIAGAGNVGLFIANELVDGGNEVLLIENDLEVVKRIPTREGMTVCAADTCEVASLKEAGLDRCDVLVAATGDDEDNLVVSLLAKQEFAVPRVIARVNHPKNHWLFNESWGIDISVSTPHLITALVGEAVSVGRLVRLFQLEGGAVALVEVTLADDTPVANQAVRDIAIPATRRSWRSSATTTW